VHEEVVDPHGAGALEVVPGRSHVELALEAQQVVVEGVDEVGLDGVLDDRVPLLGDAVEVSPEGRPVDRLDHAIPSRPTSILGASGRRPRPIGRGSGIAPTDERCSDRHRRSS